MAQSKSTSGSRAKTAAARKPAAKKAAPRKTAAKKPAAKAAAKPAVKRAKKPVAKPAAKPAPKTAAKSAPKPAPKPAAKAAPKAAPKAAAKPAPKAGSKPAVKKPAPKAAAAPAAAKATPHKSAPPKSTPSRQAAPKPVAKAAAAPPKAPAKPRKLPFGKGDYVVYPTHGVGKVTGVEKQKVAGFDLQLFVILFDSEKMTLRVPVEKVIESGLRKISSKDTMQTAVTTLKGRARSKRTMWSRRAQEYEAKINSGDPVAIAEVVRDLYRAAGQPDQSYSERQMYEAALERLANEFALVEKLDFEEATEKLEAVLAA